MRVVLHDDPLRRAIRVYVLSDGIGDTSMALTAGGWVDTPWGAEPRHYLELQHDVWAEILREAMRSGGVPQPDALADAQTVRDRLLTLVEAEWNARVEEPRP